MTLVRLLSANNEIEVLCAGRHQQCAEKLDSLFTRLSVNAELVFFLDGFIKDSKYQTWMSRQNRKYHQNLEIIDLLYNWKLSNIAETSSNIYTNTFLNVIEFVCSRHGQLTYTMNLECDQEIARFAYNNYRVLAVFSNDTDFLIFPGKWRYFSTRDLNLQTLTTIEFDRKKLLKHLNLNPGEMSIFATLAGNDIVPEKDLYDFHRRLGSSLKRKFELLAGFIRVNVRKFENLQDLLSFFAKEIYGKRFEKSLKLLEQSINSYSVLSVYEDNPHSDQLLKKNIFTFNILNRSPLNFSLVFFDLRQPKTPSYYQLSVSMFQRQAGIVLMNSENPSAPLTLYTKRFHEKSHEKVKVFAIPPPFEIPTLAELYSNNPVHDELRFNLLKWIVNWNGLQKFDLRTIPCNYMIDILTILFMLSQEVITDKEADIFLWTIKNVEKRTVPESLEPPEFVEPRAFRLAFLYVKLFVNLARSIEVCGLKQRYWVSPKTS